MFCATLKDYTVRKHMLLEIIKCINKFANLQKVGMEQTVHNCLLPSFHCCL